MNTTAHLPTIQHATLYADDVNTPSIDWQQVGRAALRKIDAFWGIEVFNRQRGTVMIQAMDRFWGMELTLQRRRAD